MANNNCTKRERFCPLPLLFSAKIPCQTTALQQHTRLPVSRRYTAGRGQPALRKHPEESRPFTEKNNQINRSIQKRHARQRAFSRSTRKAHGIPFPAAFRQRRNRQGQVCRSRPHKSPHKSQGVYLTFIPLLAPRRRDLVRRADERGISGKVSLGTFPVSKGDSVPLRGLSTENPSVSDAADLRRTPSARSALRYCRRP